MCPYLAPQQIPIVGAIIILAQDGDTKATLTTNENGYAETTELNAGTYDVTITAANMLTTEYSLTVPDIICIAFNLQTFSKVIHGVTVANPMILVPSVSLTPTVDSSMVQNSTVTITPMGALTMAEDPTVASTPGTWTLIFWKYLFSQLVNDQAIYSPACGKYTIPDANGDQTISVTTGQYSIWIYYYQDGNLIQTGAGIEKVGTAHVLTCYQPPTGNICDVMAIVSNAWECVLSASGGGSISSPSAGAGTYEIVASSTFSVSETPNGKIFDGWFLDGSFVSSSSSYTCPAQTSGTTHTLEARFH
jgi:hypothetical protein